MPGLVELAEAEPGWILGIGQGAAMKSTPLTREDVAELDLPDEIAGWFEDAVVSEVRTSSLNRVYRLELGYAANMPGAVYAKSCIAGGLSREKAMTDVFAKLGLSPEVLEHVLRHGNREWLVTAAAPGQDATADMYMREPVRLAQLLGRTLRGLHDMKLPEDMMSRLPHRTSGYQLGIGQLAGFGMGDVDIQYLSGTPFEGNDDFDEISEAACAALDRMEDDVLVHGDFCLPNVVIDGWEETSLIDLAGAGAGDRHLDLFWGCWSLSRNFGTSGYQDDFLNAYGRELVDDGMLAGIACCEAISADPMFWQEA